MNKNDFLFMLSWIIVTALSWMIGLSVLLSDYRPFYILLLGLLIGGLLSGVGQWTLLHRRMKKPTWGWILATTLGIPFGLFIAYRFQEFLYTVFVDNWTYWRASLVISFVAGFCRGVLQWLVLFRRLPNPVWLMLSSFSLIPVLIFYPRIDNQFIILGLHNREILGLISGGLSGTISAIVDGINMMIALRRNENV
jgi:hypothetical protein